MFNGIGLDLLKEKHFEKLLNEINYLYKINL